MLQIKQILSGSAVAIAAAFLIQNAASAGIPFNSAKVSLVENKVFIGDLKSGHGAQRQADTGSEVNAKEFLATDAESRAELKFADSSIIRIGQNSIFSFEAGSRTLSLKEGTMLFFIPHDSGGGTIKTPSFTAAITGTVGKVSKNMIAILKGEVRVNVDGKWYVVPEGWVLEVNNHEVLLYKFKPGFATAGLLYSFDGVLPGLTDNGSGGPFDNLYPVLTRPTHEPNLNPRPNFNGR